MKNTKLCVFCKSRIDETDVLCPFCGIEATNTNPIGSLELGSVVKKKYTIGRFVSIDGEGIVYEALVNATAEEVYIKEFLPISLCASRRPTGEVIPRPGSEVPYKTTLTDFIDLYKGLCNVAANPGLVKVYELLLDNNTAYAVTERHGATKTLREYLEQKNQKIPFETAEEMLEPIFSALLSLHEQRLLHRGVSPDTILVKEDGKLLLSGYATLALRTSKSALKPQLFPGYTAPEQYMVTEFQDTGTDIYAVAAVLYRMITGVEPQDAKERHTADNLKVARGLAGNIPNLATSAIHRALRLSISERTHDIMQLLEEFESAPSYNNSAPKQIKDNKKKSGFSPLILIVIIMVLLAAGIIYYAYSLLASSLVPEVADSESQATDLADSAVSEAINSQLTPRLIGMMYDDILADTELQQKYKFIITEEYQINYPEGQVYAQQPLPEEPYVIGQTIELRVSLGPELGVIPAELYGMTKEEAMTLLSEMGVSYEFYNRFDDSAPAGTVMYSEPAVGEDVVIDENTKVQLFIAVPTTASTTP